MNGVAVEISRNVAAARRKTSSLEESLERYCRRRWPRRTAAEVADAWGLSRDEAREVVRGRASKAVINKVAAHPKGGLAVMIQVLERATGQTVAELNAARREMAWRVLEDADDFDFSILRGRA